MLKLSLRFLSLTLLGLVLFSCGTDDIDPSDELTFGIRHDKDLSDYEDVATNNSPYNTSDYPDFSPVFAFSYSLNGSSSEDYVATGTLVDSEYIVTAGHNFYVAEEQSSPAPVSGISILSGDDPNSPDATYEVESLTFHPSWINDNRDFLGANDLCLVKLKTPITNITPATLLLEQNEVIGSTVWFCGFGDYSQQPGQDANAFSNKHAIQNLLDRANDGITSSSGGTTYTGGLLAYDFDNPSGSINSLGDDVVNSDESILGSGTSNEGATTFEGATVQGDSGGPLFIKDGGVWKVAGVLSGGAQDPIADHEDSSYGDISVFIRLSTHKTWIESVIN